MIRTNAEALRVFGLGYQPSLDQIKTRYHELLKMAHPDETGSDNEEIYAITEAYQFLLANYAPPVQTEQPVPKQVRSSKIFGAPEELKAADQRRAERIRYHKLQKQHEEHERERKQDFSRQLEEAGKSRQEAEYKDAMERIHAIRAAEVTAQIIEAMLYPDKKS